MSLIIPGSVTIPVGVVVERRPGVTPWADFAWRAVEVLENAPALAPWTVLREEEGRTLFFAGNADVALHPTDTDNYKHNLESSSPSIWVVLRAAEAAPGFKLQTVTVDAGEAHLYADSGSDLMETVPLPPGIRAALEAFVAEHHKERGFHKRKRDKAELDGLGRRGRVDSP
ncbi:MAG: DUF3305 domain-containing protein [Roseomonas sp.]|nr:DUF3305 domain-containing protein [Roseomonas sp.]